MSAIAALASLITPQAQQTRQPPATREREGGSETVSRSSQTVPASPVPGNGSPPKTLSILV